MDVYLNVYGYICVRVFIQACLCVCACLYLFVSCMLDAQCIFASVYVLVCVHVLCVYVCEGVHSLHAHACVRAHVRACVCVCSFSM